MKRSVKRTGDRDGCNNIREDDELYVEKDILKRRKRSEEEK